MMATAARIQTAHPLHCCADKSRENEQLRELVEELTKERQKDKAENAELKTMVQKLHEKLSRKN
jgi:hypothetical protein